MCLPYVHTHMHTSTSKRTFLFFNFEIRLEERYRTWIDFVSIFVYSFARRVLSSHVCTFHQCYISMRMLEARMDLMHAAKWYHWPPFSWNRYTVYRLHASILHRCLYRGRGGLCVLHPGKMEGCFTFSTKACHFAFPFYRFSSKLWLPLRFVSRCRYFTTSLPFSFGKIVRIYRCSKLLTIRNYILTSITPLE